MKQALSQVEPWAVRSMGQDCASALHCLHPLGCARSQRLKAAESSSHEGRESDRKLERQRRGFPTEAGQRKQTKEREEKENTQVFKKLGRDQTRWGQEIGGCAEGTQDETWAGCWALGSPLPPCMQRACSFTHASPTQKHHHLCPLIHSSPEPSALP